ncbi:hypothetical protein GCM10009744_63440 [Kribbella alba]|uniref:Uncharacterized protein n=1 Tax=Kribbella alba TaxID=190197 RepID=A0ABN2FWH5_9ACTN
MFSAWYDAAARAAGLATASAAGACSAPSIETASNPPVILAVDIPNFGRIEVLLLGGSG